MQKMLKFPNRDIWKIIRKNWYHQFDGNFKWVLTQIDAKIAYPLDLYSSWSKPTPI